jgi:3-isopropylmalate dehydratase small subunit
MADYGIRALISTRSPTSTGTTASRTASSRSSSTRPTHAEAMAAAEKNQEFTVDLPNQTLTLPSGRRRRFPIDCLRQEVPGAGLDVLGYLQSHCRRSSSTKKRREPVRA